jgi:anti-anti-sigma regulatory factor
MTLNEDNGVRKILRTIDIDAAGSLRQALLDGMILNVSGVEACDTAALQVFLAGRRDCSPQITGSSPAITEIAAALGLSHAI